MPGSASNPATLTGSSYLLTTDRCTPSGRGCTTSVDSVTDPSDPQVSTALVGTSAGAVSPVGPVPGDVSVPHAAIRATRRTIERKWPRGTIDVLAYARLIARAPSHAP